MEKIIELRNSEIRIQTKLIDIKDVEIKLQQKMLTVKDIQIKNQQKTIELRNDEIELYLKMIETYKRDQELQTYADFLMALRRFKEVKNIHLIQREKNFRTFLNRQKISLPVSRSFSHLNGWVNKNIDSIKEHIEEKYKVTKIFSTSEVKHFFNQKRN